MTSCDLGRYLLAHRSWYVNTLAEKRRTTQYGHYITRGEKGFYYYLGYPPTESVNRGVFIEELDFITEDSLKHYFNPKDTIFYIERAFKWGKKNSGQTRILSDKETNYPFQLIARDRDIGNEKYFEFSYEKEYNKTVQDSIMKPMRAALKKVDNDTIYLKITLREKKSIKSIDYGFVKVFQKNATSKNNNN